MYVKSDRRRRPWRSDLHWQQMCRPTCHAHISKTYIFTPNNHSVWQDKKKIHSALPVAQSSLPPPMGGRDRKYKEMNLSELISHRITHTQRKSTSGPPKKTKQKQAHAGLHNIIMEIYLINTTSTHSLTHKVSSCSIFGFPSLAAGNIIISLSAESVANISYMKTRAGHYVHQQLIILMNHYYEHKKVKLLCFYLLIKGCHTHYYSPVCWNLSPTSHTAGKPFHWKESAQKDGTRRYKF